MQKSTGRLGPSVATAADGQEEEADVVWACSKSKGNPGKYYPPGQGGRTES